jgi:hypothetical protein
MNIKKTLALCGFVLLSSVAKADEPILGTVFELEDKITFITYQQHHEGIVIRAENADGIPILAAVVYTAGPQVGRVFQVKYSTDGKGTFSKKANEIVDGQLVPVTLAAVTDIIRQAKQGRPQ